MLISKIKLHTQTSKQNKHTHKHSRNQLAYRYKKKAQYAKIAHIVNYNNIFRKSQSWTEEKNHLDQL